MNTREPEVMMERMLADCVPGGSSCDPQRVADAIREWFAKNNALLAEGSASSEGAEAVAPVSDADVARGMRVLRLFAAERGDDLPECGSKEWAIASEAVRRIISADRAAQGEHEQRSCEGSERRPIADEVVESVGSALYIYWNDVKDSVRDKYRAKVRAALESALPRGLPAGSDAQLKVIDEVIRLLESPAVMPSPLGGINYAPEHYFCLLHDFKRVRTELATAEQPYCGQDARDAPDVCGHCGALGGGHTLACQAIAAQQRQGGEQ